MKNKTRTLKIEKQLKIKQNKKQIKFSYENRIIKIVKNIIFAIIQEFYDYQNESFYGSSEFFELNLTDKTR